MDNKLLVRGKRNILLSGKTNGFGKEHKFSSTKVKKTGILMVTSFPPRECGIATFSRDLVNALNEKFDQSFQISICALEAEGEQYSYPKEVKYILDTSNPEKYKRIARAINLDRTIDIVMVQHEFGFFQNDSGQFQYFIKNIKKSVLLAFHTVLPRPDAKLKENVLQMVNTAGAVVVMTDNSRGVLHVDYNVPEEKIIVIPHGTHLVLNKNQDNLKAKYDLKGHKVLSTFGLLSSGKSIETTLYALPKLVQAYPELVFIVIGKTHPGVIKSEGEVYRIMLESKVKELNIEKHVRFVNRYLDLAELLDYLQLTDIYLFTSKDPNQAVSGTFAYAMSCACPIISTPIPQARELLDESTGIIIDFQNSGKLAEGIQKYLSDEERRKTIGNNALQKIIPTVWQNAAISHALLFRKISDLKNLRFTIPPINLNHLHALTTDFGMIQFSRINQPDCDSGYTLDDNARALISMCMNYKLNRRTSDLDYIRIYLRYIAYCLQPDFTFKNYVNSKGEFTSDNDGISLDDANGRAIWSLGYVLSCKEFLPLDIVTLAEDLFNKGLINASGILSLRAAAFIIKGLYLGYNVEKSEDILIIVQELADQLKNKYLKESEPGWNWYENLLTYANSLLPEAMLYAWQLTNNEEYLRIANESFEFLLSRIFNKDGIKVISNKSWLHKGQVPDKYGEQPIDVAYTILALQSFYDVTNREDYLKKMIIAFNWFLGQNHLNQIIYNPITGGCYDGLEQNQVNLNQGAESTVSYLMARLTIERYKNSEGIEKLQENAQLAIPIR